MAGMDVFRGDGFSMMSMLAGIESADFKPQFLGTLGLFEAKPQRTRVVAIESRANTLALIQTSPIGAPPAQRGGDQRTLRNFRTTRIAKASTIQAEELQDIRAFGSETELKQVQVEVARRQMLLRDDIDLTWEHHRLGAVQGIVVDADGSTEIVDYYDEFGVTRPDEIAINFETLQAGQLRPIIERDIVRPIIRAAKGAFVTGSYVMALCGDDFWDLLINHAEVRQTYLNQLAAAELRKGTAFGQFEFAGVTWVNYRGTDDESTVAIASNSAKFFPVNCPGLFQVAWGPSEFMPTVNMPGVPVLPLVLTDPSGREAYVTVELYSYPLFICTRPLTLRRAVTDS